MNRKAVAKIMADTTLDDSAKIEQIFALYGASVGKLKTDDDVQKAIDAALAAAPKGKVTESDEYKALQKQFDDFKYTTEVKGALKSAKAKDKFLDDIISKIDREKKIDEQLPEIKSKFGEYFDPDENPGDDPPPPKPGFGTQTTGKLPSGETGKSFNDVWGFAPKKE